VRKAAGIREYPLAGMDTSSNFSRCGARSSVEQSETQGGVEYERPAWAGVVGDHTDDGGADHCLPVSSQQVRRIPAFRRVTLALAVKSRLTRPAMLQT
jgi:hypothetical protein